AELRKQYDVANVSPDADYPADLDVLLAAQPSTLTQPQADRLTAYATSGKPVLLLLDPMPVFNLDLAAQPLADPESPPAPRATLKPLLDAAGVLWPTDRIAWDNYNPHPQLKSLPKEFVFVAKGFNQKDPITSGLQEVVLLYAGLLKARSDAASGQVTPLLETSGDSGSLRMTDLVERNMLGSVGINPDVKTTAEEGKQVPAVRVKGKVKGVNVADIDLMSEQFFELRRR